MKNEMKKMGGATVELVEDEKNANEQGRKWYQIAGQYNGINFTDGDEYAMCEDGQIVDFDGLPLDEWYKKDMVRELIEKYEE